MQPPPEYPPANIGICKARVLLGTRGVADPKAQLIAALRDGTIVAWGLVDGAWREIRPAWWYHLNSPLEDTVWFERKDTEPPTPFRAETVEVPFAQLNLLWPGPSSSDGHTSKVGEAVEATQPRVGSSSANQSSAISPRRKPGRPKGTGRFQKEDDKSVEHALALLKEGKVNSVLDAAGHVAGDVNALGYDAAVERLRKKISPRWEEIRSTNNSH